MVIRFVPVGGTTSRVNRHIAGRLLLLCAIVAVGATVGGTLSFGQSSGSGGPVKGCVDRGSGELRVVKPAKPCRRGERRLSWSLGGATGPAGPRGGPGTNGGIGPPGQRGSFIFDDFDGMPCTDNSQPGTIDISYDSNGFASLTCS
jgi:hypothetical protein